MASNGPNGDFSNRLLKVLAKQAQPLPATVKLTSVRALHREQLVKLVRELSAQEAERLRKQEEQLELREQEWRDRIEDLEAEVEDLRLANDDLEQSRSTTTRYELPRMANLIEEERARADELQARVSELESELEQREQELSRLRGPEAEAAIREAVSEVLDEAEATIREQVIGIPPVPADHPPDETFVEELELPSDSLEAEVEALFAGEEEPEQDADEATGQARPEEPPSETANRMVVFQKHVEVLQRQLAEKDEELTQLRAAAIPAETQELIDELEGRLADLEGGSVVEEALLEYARSEERTARIGALEAIVWELERGNDTSAAWRRALEDLRARHEQEQETTRETARELQAERGRRHELTQQVEELRTGQEHSQLELTALMARHSSLEEGLAEAQEALRAAEEARQQEQEKLQAMEQDVLAAHEARDELEEKLAELEDALLAAQEAREASQGQLTAAEARLSAEAEARAHAESDEELAAARSRLDDAVAARQQAEEELATTDEALQAAELELIHTKRSLGIAEKKLSRADEARRQAEFTTTSQEQEVDRLQLALREALEDYTRRENDLLEHIEQLEDALDTTGGLLAQPPVLSDEAVEDDESDEAVGALPAAASEEEDPYGSVLVPAEEQAPDTQILLEELEDERHRADELEQELETANLLLAQNSEAMECELEAVRDALASSQTKVEALESELAGIRGDHDDVRQEFNAARRAYHDTRGEADRLEDVVLSLRSSLAESRAAESALVWKLESLEEALEARLRAAEDVYEDLQASRGKPAEDREPEATAAARGELSQMRAQLGADRGTVEQLQSELEATQAALTASDADLAEAYRSVSEMRATLDKALQRDSNAAHKIRELETALEAATHERESQTEETIRNLQVALQAAVLDRDESVDAPAQEDALAALEESQEALRRLEEDLEQARLALAAQEGPEPEDEAEAEAEAPPEPVAVAQVESQSLELSQDLASAQAALSEREEQVELLELELAGVKGSLKGAQDFVRELKSQLSSQASLASELESVRKTTSRLEGELEVARGVLAEHEAKSEMLQAELTAAQAALSMSRDSQRLLKSQLDEARSEQRKATSRMRDELATWRSALTEHAEQAEKTMVFDLEIPVGDEVGEATEELILEVPTAPMPSEAAGEEAPGELAMLRDLLQEQEKVGELLRNELLAMRMELARVKTNNQALEAELESAAAAFAETEPQLVVPTIPETAPAAEQQEEQQEEQVTQERLTQALSRQELFKSEADHAKAERARLEDEVHDLERLLESECWRGLATHRDLVKAHQTLRQTDALLQEKIARLAELEQGKDSPTDRLRQAEEELSQIPEIQKQLDAARSGAAQADSQLDPQQQEAIGWLISTSPAQAEFLKEAEGVLPTLERTLSATQDQLDQTREDFKAQRKSLLEDVLTTERALDHARTVGLTGDELKRKSRRATEKLRTFDTHLEVELRSLEEQLLMQQDNRLWLMHELGDHHPPLDASQQEPQVPTRVQSELEDLRKRCEDQARQRHDVERDAMLAMQEIERERIRLEQDLLRARQELERTRDQEEEQAVMRLRLQEKVEQMELALENNLQRPRLEDPQFVRQAERIAVLSYEMDDRDSLVHWLLKELDPGFRSQRAEDVGLIAESVLGLGLSGGDQDEMEDLLHWLAVEASTAESGNGENGGNGH